MAHSWRGTFTSERLRERCALAAAGAIVVFMLAGLAIVLTLFVSLAPRAAVLDLGPESHLRGDFPIYIDRSVAGTSGFFLVHTSHEILALSDITSHPSALPVIWERTAKLFVDPALGCSFEADGRYLRGPCPRDLDRYVVTIEKGRILVDTAQLVAGQPHT
jgi:hypothetical protein